MFFNFFFLGFESTKFISFFVSMKSHFIDLKVRYSETDQMGLTHHSAYVNYLEQARISWISNLGLSYFEMEKSGVILPVSKLSISYLKPAYFDDKLTIFVELVEMPSSKLIFDYKVVKDKIIIIKAKTVLAFLNKKTKKPIRCPNYFLDKVSTLFR